jgi:hypothetical protein
MHQGVLAVHGMASGCSMQQKGCTDQDPHDENDFGSYLPGKSMDEPHRSRPTLTGGAALNDHQDARSRASWTRTC